MYINTNPEICFNRIKKRSRKGEDSIPLEYLRHCDRLHKQWLLQEDNMPSLVTVFEGNEDLDCAEDFIQRLSPSTVKLLSAAASGVTQTLPTPFCTEKHP